ncbi:MAG: hypothetical protein ABI602_04205 [Candidatus Saccharibacteria bacterium]
MSRRNNSDYEKMSRAELVAIIGNEVDPGTGRVDLIVMAMAADDRRNH